MYSVQLSERSVSVMVSDNGWVTLPEMKMLWAFADTAELEAALSLLSAFGKENTR